MAGRTVTHLYASPGPLLAIVTGGVDPGRVPGSYYRQAYERSYALDRAACMVMEFRRHYVEETVSQCSSLRCAL